MQLIIVEGCDLSGKTYAIEKIAKHFNSGFVLKNSVKPKSPRDDDKLYIQYYSIINTVKFYNSCNPGELVILDRFYPSQVVYSFLRGNKELYTDRDINIEKELKDIKAKVILLDTKIDTLRERFDDRGDEHIKKNDLYEIHRRYQEFERLTTLPVLKIDTTAKNWLKKVEQFINEV